MPLVNETIFGADKERYDSFHFMSPFSSDSPVKAWMWTINRKDDVILVPLGGGIGEFPYMYAFVFKNKVIRIEGERKASGNVRDGYEVWWRLNHIKIPKVLEPETEVIMALIKEAFDGMGCDVFEREKTKAVHFDFIASPRFVC